MTGRTMNTQGRDYMYEIQFFSRLSSRSKMLIARVLEENLLTRLAYNLMFHSCLREWAELPVSHRFVFISSHD